MSLSFYEGPLWRFVVTDLDSVTQTWLDRICLNRELAFVLNKPWQMSGRVPSDDVLVNTIGSDGSPNVAPNDRFVYGWRREDVDSAFPWVVRFSGLIMDMRDAAEAEQPYSDFTAFDPWQYLYNRPVVTADGVLLPPEGLKYFHKRGKDIILDLFTNAEDAHGPLFIDYGQTAYFAGNLDETEFIGDTKEGIIFEQGCSLGEALDILVSTGIDVVLNPIYDPTLRPGLISELNVYTHAGTDRTAAVFGWDVAPRSLVDIERQIDGTQLANRIVGYTSLGGLAITPQANVASSTKYGQYWSQQVKTEQAPKSAVALIAAADLALRYQGKRTLSFSPASDSQPLPFQGYFLGDQVNVHATKRLRVPSNGLHRVYGMPVRLDDNGLERIGPILTALPTDV